MLASTLVSRSSQATLLQHQVLCPSYFSFEHEAECTRRAIGGVPKCPPFDSLWLIRTLHSTGDIE